MLHRLLQFQKRYAAGHKFQIIDSKNGCSQKASVSLENFSTRTSSEVAKSLREKPVLQHSQIPGAPVSWRQSPLGSLNAAPSCEPGLCRPCSFSSRIPTFHHLNRACWFPCEQQLVSLSALYSLKRAARQWTTALQRATAEMNNQKKRKEKKCC